MSSALSVFVSSGVYELRDLRVAIRDLLLEFGIVPQMSEDSTFPHTAGIAPYVTCLETLEQCPLVIGILENDYGHRFDDWGSHSQYNGLSPTHAEFRHALGQGKKLNLYVHRDTLVAYQTWRSNKGDFEKFTRSHGAKIDTLVLLEEMKTRKPAPWIVPFSDASDVVKSLRGNLLNEIYRSLVDQERRNADVAGYLADQIFSLEPDKRNEIESKISPALVEEISSLRRERESLTRDLKNVQSMNEESAYVLEQRVKELDEKLQSAEQLKRLQQAALTAAAIKDAGWITYVRTHYMPKQPGRVPFHNAQEVALKRFSYR